MHLNPSEIHYSQDSIKNEFRSGHGQIGLTLDKLCKGDIKVEAIPAIGVMKRDGKWFTGDNRRLWVFRHLERLGKCTKIRVNYETIPSKKMTTKNGGMHVRVRGNPGGSWYNKPTQVRITSVSTVPQIPFTSTNTYSLSVSQMTPNNTHISSGIPPVTHERVPLTSSISENQTLPNTALVSSGISSVIQVPLICNISESHMSATTCESQTTVKTEPSSSEMTSVTYVPLTSSISENQTPPNTALVSSGISSVIQVPLICNISESHTSATTCESQTTVKTEPSSSEMTSVTYVPLTSSISESHTMFNTVSILTGIPSVPQVHLTNSICESQTTSSTMHTPSGISLVPIMHSTSSKFERGMKSSNVSFDLNEIKELQQSYVASETTSHHSNLNAVSAPKETFPSNICHSRKTLNASSETNKKTQFINSFNKTLVSKVPFTNSKFYTQGAVEQPSNCMWRYAGLVTTNITATTKELLLNVPRVPGAQGFKRRRIESSTFNTRSLPVPKHKRFARHLWVTETPTNGIGGQERIQKVLSAVAQL